MTPHTGTDRPDPAARQVRNWMSPSAVAVTTDTDFGTMIAALTATQRGILPVVQVGGEVVGVVAASDLLRAFSRDEEGRSEDGTITAEELMTEPAVTVRQDQTIDDAAGFLRADGLHHLPVVDATGRLVGLLSLVQLLEALKQDDDALSDAAVRLALAADSGVAPNSLRVRCERGRLTLAGRTATRAQAAGLAARVAELPGLVKLVDRLHWAD
ncbi:CBS domain-containing protein [Kitasatospora viridis]|uniref:CBS domain protein n=1 Tax=Kitasatospora viridis TaxID=281105 RepID=A0A561SE30_9ACTN|nr:CBS domain-containing protein [Kitasatospora viridis]TWF73095.1 CBS domain protein [Kitasatospora viridis]